MRGFDVASARFRPELISDAMVEAAARAMIAQTEGITHGKFDLLGPDVQDLWLALARVALRAGLADAHSKDPSRPAMPKEGDAHG
jgi:hypothetical protein